MYNKDPKGTEVRGLDLVSVMSSRFSKAAIGVVLRKRIAVGNSGGPAFSNLEKGLIGGVAFSKLTHAGQFRHSPSDTFA